MKRTLWFATQLFFVSQQIAIGSKKWKIYRVSTQYFFLLLLQYLLTMFQNHLFRRKQILESSVRDLEARLHLNEKTSTFHIECPYWSAFVKPNRYNVVNFWTATEWSVIQKPSNRCCTMCTDWPLTPTSQLSVCQVTLLINQCISEILDHHFKHFCGCPSIEIPTLRIFTQLQMLEEKFCRTQIRNCTPLGPKWVT